MQADIQTTGKQAAGRQTDIRQADRQADKQTDGLTGTRQVMSRQQ